MLEAVATNNHHHNPHIHLLQVISLCGQCTVSHWDRKHLFLYLIPIWCAVIAWEASSFHHWWSIRSAPSALWESILIMALWVWVIILKVPIIFHFDSYCLSLLSFHFEFGPFHHFWLPFLRCRASPFDDPSAVRHASGICDRMSEPNPLQHNGDSNSDTFWTSILVLAQSRKHEISDRLNTDVSLVCLASGVAGVIDDGVRTVELTWKGVLRALALAIMVRI